MKEYEKLSQESYNKKAYNYEKTIDGKFTSSFKIELVKAVEVQKDDRILDVACGTGTLLNQFSTLYDTKSYGVDIAENMIKVAKSRYPNIQFKVSDSSKTQFDDGFFNIITVCASFHHFSKPQQFIDEATRILAENGRTYIAEVYLPPIIRHIANIFLPLLNSGDVKFYSTNEITEMLQDYKLTDFKIIKKGYIQIISAKK